MKTNTHTNKAQQNEVIPAGYKNTKLGVIPEDWKVKKAKELFTSISDKKDSKTEIFLSVTQDKGVLPRNLVDRRALIPKEETSKYKLVNPNNFIISLRSFQGGLEHSRYRGLVSPAYTVLEEKIKINHLFFKYYFKSYNFISNLTVAVIGIRDGKQISYSSFSDIKIPLPPLPEQKKIADILTTWDKAADQIENLIANTKLQKKYLMQELLTGATRFNEFTTTNNRYKETKLGRIPEDWEVKRLGDVCEIKKGKSITKKSTVHGVYPVIGGGKTISYFHNDYTDSDVITISASGCYAGYVSFHNYKIWASDCSVITSLKNSENLYLFFYMRLSQKEIYKMQSGGAQPHVYPQDLKNIQIPLPPLPEQKKIAAALSTIDQEIEQLTKQQEIYKQEKKYLMQQLLTGATRVRVD